MALSDKLKETIQPNAEKTNSQSNVPQMPSSSTIWLPTIFMQSAEKANKDRIYGEKIPSLISTYKSLFRCKAPEEEIQKAFANLMNEVVRTVFIVPFHYDAANEFSDDRVIYCTPRASIKFNIDSIIYRCQSMTMEQMSKLAWTVENNILSVDLDWWDISRIAGSDGFHFDNRHFSNKMYPDLGSQGNDTFFLCFTGIDQCLKEYAQEKNLHIALFTVNDIIEYMALSERIRGFIINPGTETHCFISKDVF